MSQPPAEAAGSAPCVFLSHAREDEAWARRLREAFEKVGVRVVRPNVAAGMPWQVELQRALAQADAVVLLFSQGRGAKAWGTKDTAAISAFAAAGGPVFAVSVGRAVPPRWTARMRMDTIAEVFGEPDHPRTAEDLAEAAIRIAKRVHDVWRTRASAGREAPPPEQEVAEDETAPEAGDTEMESDLGASEREVPGAEAPGAEASGADAPGVAAPGAEASEGEASGDGNGDDGNGDDGNGDDPHVTPPRRVYARIDSDALAARDLIGIERDVRALAALVCAKDVAPPLSIGLFGDWGSGKSFFMREMRRHVDATAKAARKAEAANETTAFHGRIAQIEFNAWHYVEGNLWASLVEHIFKNLRLGGEGETEAAARRRAVAEKMGEARAEVKNAQRDVEKAQEDLRAAEDSLERARREAAQASERAEKVRRGVLLPDVFPRDRLPEVDLRVLRQLDVPVDALETTGKLGEAVHDAQAAATGLVATARRLVRQRNALVAAAPMLLAGAAVGGGAYLLGEALPGFDLTALVEGAAGVASAAALALQRVNGEARRVRKALARIDAQLQDIEKARQDEGPRLDQSVKELNEKVAQKATALEDAKENVRRKELDLASLTPAKALSDFIEERAKGDDYRKHLGLVALVRSDFERLSDLMVDVRDDKPPKDLPKIDVRHRVERIVLYIDDLDRCPPEKVVDVLQAVHLLLAFPLFTVVVAVDARWISAALDKRYRELLRAAGEPQLPLVIGRDVATPHDYLEKIFQVPFWVPPMTDEASRSLLAGLLDGAPQAHPRNVPVNTEHPPEFLRVAVGGTRVHETTDAAAEKPGTPRPQVETPVRPVVPVGPAPTDSRLAPAEEGLEEENAAAGDESASGPEEPEIAVDVNPNSLVLTEGERRFMEALTPLVGRTPRALKRFLNSYRIIRASLPDAAVGSLQADGALAGGSRRILLMLALVVGAPDQSRAIFDALRASTRPSMPFTDWLEATLPEPEAQDDDWRRVARALESKEVRAAGAEPVSRFAEDLPLVARFSFNLDPLGAHR